MPRRQLLLDTCATIAIATGERLGRLAAAAIREAREAERDLLISPAVAWEIWGAVAAERLSMTMDLDLWFAQVIGCDGIGLVPLSPAIVIAATRLPGAVPRNPIDRLLAATVRVHDLMLVTRDRLLLDYARDGHIAALAC